MILGTTITTLEIKFYMHAASTPTVSVKLTNLELFSFSYGVANGIEGGLSDESYMIGPGATGDFIYGFKDWVHGQSFAYNFGTHALVPY